MKDKVARSEDMDLAPLVVDGLIPNPMDGKMQYPYPQSRTYKQKSPLTY